MGNEQTGNNQGPIGIVGINEETGERFVTVDQTVASVAMGGEPLYMAEVPLYAIAARIVERFKQYDAERFEPVKAEVVVGGVTMQNGVSVLVSDLRELEAFMDAAGRTTPLADKAQELYLSGRADERWIKVAKPWQVGAAFANPSVGCTLQLTSDGYCAALVESPSW